MELNVHWQEDTHLWAEVEKAYESDGKWIVEGWASTSELDSEGLRMTKSALEDMVREFREMRTVLHNHQSDEEVGAVLETTLKKKSGKPEVWGCWVKVLISKTCPDIWKKIREKVLNGFSIRGRAKVQDVMNLGRKIQEAIEFVAAELSVVSVRALRGATIESVYVEKLLKSLLKEGGSIMDVKDLEKIDLDVARSAITDLVKGDEDREAILKALEGEEVDLEAVKGDLENLLKDEEEREAVRKILEAIEVEKAEEEPSKMDLAKTACEALSDEEKKALADMLGITPEKSEEKSEERQVMDSLAGGVKIVYEQLRDALAKSPEEAFAACKKVLEDMKKLVEAYPYPYPATGKKAEEEEEEEEEEEPKKSEEQPPTSEDAIAGFTSALEGIGKSLETAAQTIQSEQIVKLGTQVLELQEAVKSMTNVLENEVPIRKALIDPQKEKEKKKKETAVQKMLDSDEYKNAPPAEGIRMLMRAGQETLDELSSEQE